MNLPVQETRPSKPSSGHAVQSGATTLPALSSSRRCVLGSEEYTWIVSGSHRLVVFGILLAVSGCGSAATDRSGSEVSGGEAEPVDGVSTLVAMPHGDTLTVPAGYEFVQEQGVDSLVGRLIDDAGQTVFEYDACGLAGLRVSEDTGARGRAVNADFYYAHFPESWPGLVVTFTERGPTNLIFDESVRDEDALSLAETYNAVDRTTRPADAGSCYFDEG